MSLPKDHVRRPEHANRIISQVAEWLRQEKAKQAARRPRKTKAHGKIAHASDATETVAHFFSRGQDGNHHDRKRRSSSDLSDSGLALEKLEEILSLGLSIDQDETRIPTEDKAGSNVPPPKSSRKLSKLMARTKSAGTVSDSDARDEESVPSAEVTLDNSKTLGYRGGAATSHVDLPQHSKWAAKEEDPWVHFKQEIVRLTHTLKVSGWRRVSIEQAAEIEVERLSGALTNAVYVVTPPEKLTSNTPAVATEGPSPFISKKTPKWVTELG